MRYSDDPVINRDVELWLLYMGETPFWPIGQTPPPAMTRAQVIEAIRIDYGQDAADSVKITVH